MTNQPTSILLDTDIGDDIDDVLALTVAFPAFAKAREAARRISCVNNLKQTRSRSELA